MQKPFYSNYLDIYLDGCQKLIDQKILTKETAMNRLDIPLIAMNDLFHHRYNFTLSKDQTENLFKEVDKMYFFMKYTDEERDDIVLSYSELSKKSGNLSPKEFTMFKHAEGQLERVGYFEKDKKKPKHSPP
jgi:hypothetical protein